MDNFINKIKSLNQLKSKYRFDIVILKSTKDRYLRSLVRNTFTFHLNEIFATIQNEYTDWTNVESLSDLSNDLMDSKESSSYFREFNPYQIQHETSMALTDKLYTSPIQQV